MGRSFTPLSKTNIHIPTKKIVHLFKKHKFCKFKTSEIQIENYDLICSDRNRHGGDVACFIRNDLSYNTKLFLLSEIENIFIDIFLPLSKALLLGTIYRPPSQGSFTETITEHFAKIITSDTEIYILGDFNINPFSKQKYIFHQTNSQCHLKLKNFSNFVLWMALNN